MKSIVVTVPHRLSVAEARRRIAAEIEHFKSAYVDKLAHSEINWVGDSAVISVVALAQEIKARIDVMVDSVRIEIILPWLLASLAGPIQERLTSTTRETLAIGHSPKEP
jgi:hypothetical protein